MTAILSSLVVALGWALVHFLWQGLLVGAVAALAMALLGNARPQARYAVACLALALCLALPLATLVRGTVAAPGVAAAIVGVGMDAPAATSPLQRGFGVATDGWRDALQPRLPTLVALWSLGAALLSLRMSLGLAWVARAGRPGHGRPDPYWQSRLDALATRMALAHTVLLRVVDDLDGPVAARFWRPVVLVPAALVARLPPDLLEALLAHELAHVRRHDYLVNLVQGAVEALLFYHPVVWWLSRRIRIEREQIADDLAAQALGEPRRLALALNELAHFRAPTAHLAPAAHGGLLMSRIQRLIRPRKHALDWKLALPILGLSLACLSVLAQGTAGPAVPATSPTSERVNGTFHLNEEDSGEQFALVGKQGTTSFVSASHRDLREFTALRDRIGGDFLWFRRDGHSYVVQDPVLLGRANAAWQPTQPVSAKMEVLGEQMEVHGKKMEAIGARMERHAGAGEPSAREMEALGAQMQALNEELEPLVERLALTGDLAERERLESDLDRLSSRIDGVGEQMDRHGKAIEAAHAPLAKLGEEMEIAGEPMQALGAQMDVLGKEMERLSDIAMKEIRVVIDQAVREGKALPVESAASR